MIGLKTIGNATLIAYDKKSILATDPWLGEEDFAYFGSWNLSHKIPLELKKDIQDSKYIWISHGHPDHLNSLSMERFKGKKILLPDHVGSRIKNGFIEDGFETEILPDRKWIHLSDNIKVFCITTVIQDAILLIDVNGYLFVNLNDAGSRGATRIIRKIARKYRKKFLLTISGYGDADMINFFDEHGEFIEPPAANNLDVGNQLSLFAKSLCIDAVIPFSSFHVYQRKDSIWANNYTTPMEAYKKDLHNDIQYVEPFSNINCSSGEITKIEVEENLINPIEPNQFGDDWNDELTNNDIIKITDYFSRKEKVKRFLSFLNFRVGGKDNFIKLEGIKNKGITFEVPKNSLMLAIELEIFDDLLIGNFMKTTLHNMRSLYESDFNYYITKYADNGRAESIEELETYFKIYNKRIGSERFYELFLDNSSNFIKRLIPTDRSSMIFKTSTAIYYKLK